MTQNHVIVFYSYCFLRWWGPCRHEVLFFPALCGWKHPWSRVHRCHFLFSFPFIALHFAFIPFHFVVIVFHVPSCSVDVYQTSGSSNVNVLKPVSWASAQTFAFFHMSLSFLFSSSYQFGVLCKLPSSVFMNITMSELVIFFYSYRFLDFLGRQRVGSVKAQTKLKWNAWGYYIIPSIFPINCVPNTFSECVSLLICFQLLNFDYLVCFARFGCNEPSEKFRFGR